MNIFKEIYKTILDFIIDLRSTRNQLIWIATGLFIYSVVKGVSGTTLGVVAGLLTIVYTFYFASKHNQSKNEHEIKIMDKNNNGIDDSEEE